MLIQETFVNETKGWRIGQSDPYEPFTDNIGRLFRDLQKEYGRCTGHVYVDQGRKSMKIGWVFEKRMRYEDARPSWPIEDQHYTRSVWVTLYAEPDTVTRTRHYFELGGKDNGKSQS